MKSETISATEWSIKRFRIISILFCFILSLFSSVQAQRQDTLAIRQAIEKQLEIYPNSTLCDIYKSFFQDAYGPGHLIQDTAYAIKYLKYEVEKSEESNCKTYEQVGIGENFYRLNLVLIKENKIDIQTFFNALLRSVELSPKPEITQWAKRWSEIEKTSSLFKDKIAGNYEQDKEFIEQMLSKGEYMMRHSKLYNANYHPHYRLIHRSIFEQEILPLIKN